MKLSCIPLLLTTLALAATTAAEPAWPIQENAARIIGGTQPEAGEYPYYTAVFTGPQGFLCGGVLIAPQVVLYNALCATIFGTEEVYAQVGMYAAPTGPPPWEEPLAGGAVPRDCASVEIHPDFDLTTFDFQAFALCLLDEPVFISEDRTELVLNSDAGVPEAGDDLIVIGFGATTPEVPPQLAPFLQQITLTAISNEQCDAETPNPNGVFPITEDFLCASASVAGAGTCNGDQGSPLIKRTDVGDGKFRDEVVGLGVGGGPCDRDDPNGEAPDVFARTSSGYEWIKETVCIKYGFGDAKLCREQSNTKGAKKTKKGKKGDKADKGGSDKSSKKKGKKEGK